MKQNMPFDQWMNRVDIAISNICYGYTSRDIDDWTYNADYNARLRPTNSARRALRNAGLVL